MIQLDNVSYSYDKGGGVSNVNLNLNDSEYAFLIGHVIGVEKDEIVERVTESIEEVGLEGKADRYPQELSGGEQQRACVARALVKDPDIVLADEPTGNLDPVTSFELIKLLEEVNQEGKTILMASHNYNLIKGRGHRIIEIQNGSVRQS